MRKRTSAIIDFEGVPLVVEGSGWIWRDPHDPQGGGLGKAPYMVPLVASFPSDAAPEAALRAITDQWNATPDVDAHYRVVAHGRRLDLVPYEVLGLDGSYHPYASVLDMTVLLPTATGEPMELFDSIVAEWEVAAHAPIGRPPFVLRGEEIEFGSPESVALNSREADPEAWVGTMRAKPFKTTRDVTLVGDRATARVLLHDVLEKSQPANQSLELGFVLDMPGWVVSYLLPLPEVDGSGCTFVEEPTR